MLSSLATSLLVLMIASPSAAVQDTAVKGCPLLDTKEAAALTGPGAELYSVLPSTTPDGKKTYVCFFGVGQGRSLTVKTGPSLAKTTADYQKMYEPLRKMSGQRLEPGPGEYAYSSLESDAASITAVKGTLTLTFELKGTALAAADMDKLRAAITKVFAKLP